jgi:hypothetical protein
MSPPAYLAEEDEVDESERFESEHVVVQVVDAVIDEYNLEA